jgi:hypothetical protein
MKPDDLDRLLSKDDVIVPSSGFAEAVMDAVLREAVTPAPLPFPWKRALPGIVAGVFALIAAGGCIVLLAPLAHALPPDVFERALAGTLSVVTSTSGLAVLTLVLTLAAVTSLPELFSERLLRERQ